MTLPAKWTKEYVKLMEKRRRRAQRSRARMVARGQAPVGGWEKPLQDHERNGQPA